MDKLQDYLIEVEALLNCKDVTECFDKMREIELTYDVPEHKINADFAQTFEHNIKTNLELMRNQPKVQKEINRAKLLQQILKFIPDRKRAEETIAALEVEHHEPELHNLRSLSKLIEKGQSKYYVDGLFRAGLFLIAGYAKTGKSLWLFLLSISLALGTNFLNRKTRQCNVLIIENEEPLPGTAERLLNSCIQDFYLENPDLYEELLDSYRLIVVKGLDIGVDVEKIFKIVDEHNIQAVFVDSLRASIAKGGITEMDMACVGVLYQFQAEIHNRDMLGVIIHHTSKASNTDNPLKMIGGNNGLVGANDGNGILMINKEKTHEGGSTVDFMLIPRNDNPCKINYAYNEQEACRWDFTILEDNSLSEDYLKMMREVLTVLQELYDEWVIEDPECENEVKGLTSNQLANAIERDKKDLIKCLNDLDRCGGIYKYRRGKVWVYAIPIGGSPMYYLVEEVQKRNELLEKQNELDKQFLIQLLKCQTLSELEILYSDLDEDDKARIREKRTVEHESHIFKLRHPQKFNVGDRVYCTYFPLDENGKDTLTRKFGVRTITDVQLKPPAKNSGDKFNEQSWKYYLNDSTNEFTQDMLTFESEYVGKSEDVAKLEKLFEKSPDDEFDRRLNEPNVDEL